MSHTAIVKARDYWTDTGFQLDPARAYRFDHLPDPKAPWKDASITCDPIAGHDTAYLRPFRRFCRAHQFNYFVLVGSIDKDPSSHFPLLDPRHQPFTPSRGGRLWVFANDIKFFYFNNHGQITLRIHPDDRG